MNKEKERKKERKKERNIKAMSQGNVLLGYILE